MRIPTRTAALLTAAAALAACGLRGDGIARDRIRNVVVVTLDTTRADHIGAYGYGDIDTPALDALAARGVLFETAVTPVPLTLPSHTTIFTGQFPLHHGVRNNGTYQVPSEALTLAEVLRGAGFRTGAVIGAFVLDSRYGLDQGFQTYDDNLHGGKDGPMFMFDERPGRMVTAAGLAWLDGVRPDERFFLWLHYFDPHANYEPPPPYDVLYDGRPYDGEIAGADAQIGRVVDGLRERGRLDDTLLVVTADHGESLGEHGEKTHSLLLYDATLHVPLVLSHPALPQGRRVSGQVRTADIFPTVLDLLALDVPDGLDGVSLTSVIASGRAAGRDSYIETLVPRQNNGWAELRGVRTSDAKYVRAPRTELFDLPADPRELHNRYPERPQDAAPLDRQLDAWLRGDVAARDDSRAALQLSHTDRERLAALGYNVGSHGEQEPASGARPDPKDMVVQWEAFQAAQGLMRTGKHREAVEALRAVVARDPGNVLAYSSLGSALQALGDFDGARQAYETVTALDPRRANGRIALARMQRRRGDHQAAFATLKDALAVDPDTPEVACEFAELFHDNGNTAKAIEWYEEAVRRDPLYVKAMIGLSNTYHRAGRDSDARAALERALRIDSRNADALYNLGVVAEAQGDDKEALGLYRRALEAEPDHVPSLNNLGSYHDRAGDAARAIAFYRRVRELNADHFEATYNLGTLLLRSQRAREAIPLLEHARQLRPQTGAVVNNLALAYVAADRRGDAVALLRPIADADAKNPTWWLRLARIEADGGQTAAAREHVARAIATGGDTARRRVAADPALAKLAPAGG